MAKIEKRADELKAQNVNRKDAISILKSEFPRYHETYYLDLTSDFPEASVNTIKSKPVPIITQPVKVVGFDMPFSDMVWFMVKWIIAAIPAFIILFFIGLIVSLLLTALGIVLI